MAAITWQNINAPKTDYMPLGMAQNSFNGAIEGLQGLLKRKEAIDTANYAQEGVNNRNTLFNTLYGANTPEQMTALQQSGKLGEMMTGFGSNIADRDKVQAAIDGRLGNLRRDELAGIQHADAVEEVGESKIRQQAYALANRGAAFVPQAQSLIDTMKKPAEEQAYLRDLARRFVTEGHADVDQAAQVASNDHAAKLRPGLETLQRLSIANQQQSLENARLVNREKRQEIGSGNLVSQFSNRLKAEQDAFNAKGTALATRMGITVNKAGVPDFDVSADKLLAYQAALGDAPSSSVAKAQLEKALRDANVPAGKMITYLEQADKLFGTGGVVSAADSTRMEAKVKQEQEKGKQRLNNNMFYAKSDLDRGEEISKTMTAFETKMGKDTWFVSNHRNNILELMEKGLPIGNASGDGKMYTIPPKLMNMAFEHMDRGRKAKNLFLNDATDQVTDWLTNYVTTNPAYAKDMQEFDKLKLDPNRMNGVKTIRDQFKNVVGMPGDVPALVDSLNAAIEIAQKRQQGGTGGDTPKK